MMISDHDRQPVVDRSPEAGSSTRIQSLGGRGVIAHGSLSLEPLRAMDRARRQGLYPTGGERDGRRLAAPGAPTTSFSSSFGRCPGDAVAGVAEGGQGSGQAVRVTREVHRGRVGEVAARPPGECEQRPAQEQVDERHADPRRTHSS